MWSLNVTFQSLCTAAGKKLQLDTIMVLIDKTRNIANLQETVGLGNKLVIFFLCKDIQHFPTNQKKPGRSRNPHETTGEKMKIWLRFSFPFYNASGVWLMSKNGRGAGHDR